MSVSILCGDCRDMLRQMPDESVHCAVTSPPYWGLRDYGTAKWEGGDAACDHSGVARRCDAPGRNDKQSTQKGSSSDRVSRDCLHCGAIRIDSQLGLEPDFRAYVAAMVEVFREVRRVLRKDGTLWLNLGDSYASGEVGRHDHKEGKRMDGAICDLKEFGQPRQHARLSTGLQPKNLIGIPWRVAFALQEDGWWLRQDIIWSKPNPMPESVTDRCTKAHEYLFMLTKSPRYFYDQEAIKEENSERYLDPQTWRRHGQAKTASDKHGASIHADGGNAAYYNGLGRNKRSVWEIATQPFSEAHFATFPPALIEPCIKAGCPKDGVVLDPFAGAGTTGLVADRLQRSAILIELNPTYADMSQRRIKDDAPLFAEVDDYDASDDFARGIEEAYRVIRARKANGGKGWGGWE